MGWTLIGVVVLTLTVARYLPLGRGIAGARLYPLQGICIQTQAFPTGDPCPEPFPSGLWAPPHPGGPVLLSPTVLGPTLEINLTHLWKTAWVLVKMKEIPTCQHLEI